TEFDLSSTSNPKRIAVVGAGPAGLSFSVYAAQKGHSVTLFDTSPSIGGLLNLAVKIPGKEEFHETLRYFSRQLELLGVKVVLNKKVTVSDLILGRDAFPTGSSSRSTDTSGKSDSSAFDEIVIATGVTPRVPDLQGVDNPKVLSYVDAINNSHQIGRSVAIVGAGGIGFDVATLLTHEGASSSLDNDLYLKEWGIDGRYQNPGGLLSADKGNISKDNNIKSSDRTVYLMQRKATKVGANLGKTTGWIHRALLKKRGVIMLSDVSYEKIDEKGLHIARDGKKEVLNVDNIIICAGQESLLNLAHDLKSSNVFTDSVDANGKKIRYHIIGGAYKAGELDAKRAIEQGLRLACEV
ncbi:MAG: FAD-dependent oxidoreductase, partial [Desulfamplus sp.]|nr:FAD-dependent oxidoreductase [Desulfamplus sp.]